jgi:hypothetical protein
MPRETIVFVFCGFAGERYTILKIKVKLYQNLIKSAPCGEDVWG